MCSTWNSLHGPHSPHENPNSNATPTLFFSPYIIKGILVQNKITSFYFAASGTNHSKNFLTSPHLPCGFLLVVEIRVASGIASDGQDASSAGAWNADPDPLPHVPSHVFRSPAGAPLSSRRSFIFPQLYPLSP